MDVDFASQVGDFLEKGPSSPPPPAAAAPVVAAVPAPAGNEPPVLTEAIVPVRAPGPGIAPVTPAPEPHEEPSIPADVLSQEPPAPPAPAEVEEPEPSEIKNNPKARNAWTQSKQERKALKAQAAALEAEKAELQKQLTAAKASPSVTPEEIEVLKAEKTQLEERVGKLDISQSAVFRQQYDLPINELFNKSLSALVHAGKSQEAAKQLLQRLIRPGTDAATIQEMLQGEPPMLQGMLYQNALQAAELQKRRTTAITDWRSTRAQLQEEEQRQAQASFAQQMETHVSTGVDALRTEGSWLYKESAVDQKWNATIAQRLDVVKGILKTATPEVVAKYVADGVAAKTYREWGEANAKRVRALEAELRSMGVSRPAVGAREEAPPPPPPAKPVTPATPDDFLGTMFSRT